MVRGLGHKNAAKIISADSKGQLILKGHFGVFKSTKKNLQKTKEICVRISALASKKRSNQNNNKGTLLY